MYEMSVSPSANFIKFDP